MPEPAASRPLTPAQARLVDAVLDTLPACRVVAFQAPHGHGKSTMLAELHRQLGGCVLTAADVIDGVASRHPFALEESFATLLLDALADHGVVLVDDLHLVDLGNGCGNYPRGQFLHAAITAVLDAAEKDDKRLIFATAHNVPTPCRVRGAVHVLDDWTPEDYHALCRPYLGRAGDAIDYRKVHRFAPHLSGYQVRHACAWLRTRDQITTESLIDYLTRHDLTSNVDLGEVQPASFDDLKGIEDVIRALEANVIVPLEHDALAQELDIQPKRGVLLAGPPGTGKTTVGRALAHRLRGKFFLIDGTFISGTGMFYQQVHQVFEAARRNSPSVIFIDDTDVIFENGEEAGLYRYLLTMLDGLESKSNARVCVMMTAMDVGGLPPALIRSGRIELWLETRLPDAEARETILRQRLAGLPDAFASVEVQRLAAASEGLTGADLKRVIEDGKIIFAYDRVRGAQPRSPTDYFLSAIEAVRANRDRYAEAEARARQRRPVRPPWFGGGGLDIQMMVAEAAAMNPAD